ncbi:MAG: redoxin domain-containing protein [Clostridia bacterium]|nr:redoxin domain-containing protein [Clostridia bacterium]
MNKKNIIFLICAILILIVAIIIFVVATSQDSGNEIGDIKNTIKNLEPVETETFSFSDSAGKNYYLSNFNDKPIALILWSSDSENALEIIQLVEQYYNSEQFKNSINFLVVNTNEPNKNIKQIVENCEFNIPVYYDTNSTATNKYTFSKLPYLVFIKEDGTISNELKPNETQKNLTPDVFEANLELLLFKEEY